MVITLLLLVLGTYVCVRVARAALVRLGLDAREALLWLGLAELPAQPVSRRPRTHP